MPTDDGALLAVEGLARTFGDFAVFSDLSFTVPAGHALALTGPNGAGKSTLLRCLAGTDTPTAGTITFDGRPLDERSPQVRQDMAVVMDDLDFFPDLSVIEHLDLLARAHRVPDPDPVVDAVLEDVGLTAQAGQLPGTLSSGQRRRLALASAFVRPRRLLVLDEPEQRLDRDGLAWLAERLAAEKAAGLTLVLASHDPGLVEHLADDVLQLGE